MIPHGESIALLLVAFEKQLRQAYREDLDNPEKNVETEARIRTELEAREKEIIDEWIRRSAPPAFW